MRPLLVGESNPYGANPRFALYPMPERSAGGRLCRLVLGMRMAEYLRSYDRANLCAGKWAAAASRAEAARLATSRTAPIVLLGANPSANAAVLPHPSGLCRLWSEQGAFERARAALRAAGCPVGTP